MFVVLSGSSQPANSAAPVAQLLFDQLLAAGHEAHLIDLATLPDEVYAPSAWVRRPEAFAAHEEALLDAQGLLVVVEERGGSLPGELKLFLDLVRYPGAFAHLPCAFVGVSDGPWGAMRAVEQVELALHHLGAHLFGSRIFMRHIRDVLDVSGQMPDPGRRERLRQLVLSFGDFAVALRPADIMQDAVTEESLEQALVHPPSVEVLDEPETAEVSIEEAASLAAPVPSDEPEAPVADTQPEPQPNVVVEQPAPV